jgi:hypothetical protein
MLTGLGCRTVWYFMELCYWNQGHCRPNHDGFSQTTISKLVNQELSDLDIYTQGHISRPHLIFPAISSSPNLVVSLSFSEKSEGRGFDIGLSSQTMPWVMHRVNAYLNAQITLTGRKREIYLPMSPHQIGEFIAIGFSILQYGSHMNLWSYGVPRQLSMRTNCPPCPWKIRSYSIRGNQQGPVDPTLD